MRRAGGLSVLHERWGEQELVAALRRALGSGELTLAYQVLCDLPGRRPRGVEALVRWMHPTAGEIRPDHFVPTALRHGLGEPLTLQVLSMALAQCGRWRRLGLDVPVSVNIPPGVLAPRLAADVVALLERDDVPPHLLTMEVTEQACTDIAAARTAMAALARMGVRLSLDDFGLGDSSLLRLQRLQFDEVKIDRTFVHHAARNPTDRLIVRFVTDLAHGLGMRVVAEGIETADVLDTCAELGVDVGQGYHLHVPSSPVEVPRYFVAWQERPLREATPFRVVVVDDEPLMRHALRWELERSAQPVEVVGEAGTGRDAVALVESLQPDVVLLDVAMPGGDGISAAEAIRLLAPAVKVIMVTASDDPEHWRRASEAGVAGYLLKERSFEDVVNAVVSVATGGAWPVAA